MSIAKAQIKVTTAGAAGSATGSATSRALNGKLLSVYLDFTGAAATADTTVSYGSPALGTIVVVTDSATDVLLHPRAKPVDNANAAIANAFDSFPLAGTVTVTVAQSNAGTDNVVATLIYETGSA